MQQRVRKRHQEVSTRQQFKERHQKWRTYIQSFKRLLQKVEKVYNVNKNNMENTATTDNATTNRNTTNIDWIQFGFRCWIQVEMGLVGSASGLQPQIWSKI